MTLVPPALVLVTPYFFVLTEVDAQGPQLPLLRASVDLGL